MADHGVKIMGSGSLIFIKIKEPDPMILSMILFPVKNSLTLFESYARYALESFHS